jgi:hypothetical protein
MINFHECSDKNGQGNANGTTYKKRKAASIETVFFIAGSIYFINLLKELVFNLIRMP